LAEIVEVELRRSSCWGFVHMRHDLLSISVCGREGRLATHHHRGVGLRGLSGVSLLFLLERWLREVEGPAFWFRVAEKVNFFLFGDSYSMVESIKVHRLVHWLVTTLKRIRVRRTRGKWVLLLLVFLHMLGPFLLDLLLLLLKKVLILD
jgi:hypothetical protein